MFLIDRISFKLSRQYNFHAIYRLQEKNLLATAALLEIYLHLTQLHASGPFFFGAQILKLGWAQLGFESKLIQAG